MKKDADKGAWIGGKLHMGGGPSKYAHHRSNYDTEPQHAKRWRNRRPICPYGCGEEGTLLEIIVKDGKAMGYYTHSESMKPFTAELQMAPKPTGRTLKLGLDGEYHMVEEETT